MYSENLTCGHAVRSYEWLDSETLLASVIPEAAGPPPPQPRVPPGPSIQDNAGGVAAQARIHSLRG